MDDKNKSKAARAALNVGSSIPFIGGVLAAISAHWGEREQDHANSILRQWIQMLEDELKEKGQTIAEIMVRVNMQDERIKKRLESDEYQKLLKKSFRKWSAIDSESKRQKIRNILSNAASTDLVSDDVVSLFIEWLETYSDFHFEVIGQIYQNTGVTRGGIWHGLGRPPVREDSADADLYKLLIRDLSMGGIIRQHRATDRFGNFVKKAPAKSKRGQGGAMKSAFDQSEQYELTEIGKQFVHYAMNELAPRIAFDEEGKE